MIRIEDKYPPNWDRIKKTFPITKDVVFCYDDCIYNPFHLDIPKDVIVHEEVHALRQKEMGVTVWWERYLLDPQFRLEEEVLAYRAQLAFITKRKSSITVKIAQILSSPLYGRIVSYSRAYDLLTRD